MKSVKGLAAGLLLVLAVCTSASAQGPATVRLVVGVPAGGVLDPYARVTAEHMKVSLNKVLIIDNRPGANGNIAAQVVRDAPADGNTIWIGTQSMTEINPSVYSKLQWSMDDFVPIIKGVEAPLVLVVHPSVPAKTLAELVDYVKKNKGKLAFASFSPGTPSHFLGFQLNEKFGLDLSHVAYKGSGQQITDMIAGHALIGFTQLGSAVPQIKAGKLNAIAVTSTARSRYLPDVVTFTELGHPDFTTTIWFGMFMKAGTPDDVLKAYIAAAKAAHEDAAVKQQLEKLGFDVVAQTGPQVAADIKKQQERWAKIVKTTGFKAD